MSVVIVENREQVIKKLTEIIANIASDSIKNNGSFNIGVSGGSVATFLTESLPKISTDYNKWNVFFCDERLVAENNPDSTFGHYKKYLIDSKVINIEEKQFVKIKQGLVANEAADDYAEQIRQTFQLQSDTLPSFDLLLLGMGPDGHTCSLFPGHELLNEKSKLVAPITDSPKPPPSRITLTFPVINNAKNCVFAICGEEKADMVKKILKDKEDLPSTRVKPTAGNLYWIVDKSAGQYLNANS